MFRAIPARRPCAATCYGIVEIQPSVRAAFLALTWISAIMAMTLLAVALPLPARIALCLCAATGCVPVIRSTFLLAGPAAVRSLRWSGNGLWVRFGGRTGEETAELAAGSFRMGQSLLVLRLKTCDRTACVFIDGGGQEIQGFRRLCRYLQSGLKPPS
jgi:hypothetical protein